MKKIFNIMLLILSLFIVACPSPKSIEKICTYGLNSEQRKTVEDFKKTGIKDTTNKKQITEFMNKNNIPQKHLEYNCIDFQEIINSDYNEFGAIIIDNKFIFGSNWLQTNKREKEQLLFVSQIDNLCKISDSKYDCCCDYVNLEKALTCPVQMDLTDVDIRLPSFAGISFYKENGVTKLIYSYKGKQIGKDGTEAFDLYEGELSGTSISNSKRIDILSDFNSYDAHPSLSEDGKLIVFASTRDSIYNKTMLWYSIKKNGSWEKPKKVFNNMLELEKSNYKTPFIFGNTIVFADDTDDNSKLKVVEYTIENDSLLAFDYNIKDFDDYFNMNINKNHTKIYYPFIDKSRCLFVYTVETDKGLDIFYTPFYEEPKISLEIELYKQIVGDSKRIKDTSNLEFKIRIGEIENIITANGSPFILPTCSEVAIISTMDSYNLPCKQKSWLEFKEQPNQHFITHTFKTTCKNKDYKFEFTIMEEHITFQSQIVDTAAAFFELGKWLPTANQTTLARLNKIANDSNLVKLIDYSDKCDTYLYLNISGYTDSVRMSDRIYNGQNAIIGFDLDGMQYNIKNGSTFYTNTQNLKDKGQNGNIILSKLRAFHTFQALDTLLSHRYPKWNLLKANNKIILDLEGYGIHPECSAYDHPPSRKIMFYASSKESYDCLRESDLLSTDIHFKLNCINTVENNKKRKSAIAERYFSNTELTYEVLAQTSLVKEKQEIIKELKKFYRLQYEFSSKEHAKLVLETLKFISPDTVNSIGLKIEELQVKSGYKYWLVSDYFNSMGEFYKYEHWGRNNLLTASNRIRNIYFKMGQADNKFYYISFGQIKDETEADKYLELIKNTYSKPISKVIFETTEYGEAVNYFSLRTLNFNTYEEAKNEEKYINELLKKADMKMPITILETIIDDSDSDGVSN